MKSSHPQSANILLLFLWLNPAFVSAQIAFEFNAGTGLVYVLLVVFFIFYYITPIVRYIYVHYLTEAMEKASQQIAKAQKRVTAKMSDAGRKVSQSVRSV